MYRHVLRTALLFLTLTALSLLGAAPAPGAEPTEVPTTRPASPPAPLVPGRYRRTLVVDGRQRSYWVHVPPGYDRTKPTPVVLAFHGAFMNGESMPSFSGLSKKADQAGFIVVYPNGVGFGEAFLFFNAWAEPDAAGPGMGPPDDTRFTAKLLDDLATVCNVDPKRVYATGMSNGGMMSNRLGSELSDRIAAIAPVGGTLAIPNIHPTRPVPVIIFHGTADTVVPYDGSRPARPHSLKFKSVDATVKAWVVADGCSNMPTTTELPDTAHDGTTVKREVYGSGKDGAEVVVYTIVGGGHTWPGRQPPVAFLGKSTANISADDLIWDFFEKHPMK